MPIISTIGRRAPRVRLLITGIYLLLGLGSLTMLYPFLLMIAGTSKSGVDTLDSIIIPRFLYDDNALYRKDVEGFFNEKLMIAKAVFAVSEPSFRHFNPEPNPNKFMVAEWHQFLNEEDIAPEYYEIAYVSCPVSRGTQPLNLRRFKKSMVAHFDGNIERMNHEMETDFVSWNDFRVDQRYPMMSRTNTAGQGSFYLAYSDFKSRRPVQERFYPSVGEFYRDQFLQSQYTRNIAVYNESHDSDLSDWSQIVLPRRYPDGSGFTALQRRDWEIFVREIISLIALRFDDGLNPAYRRYLAAKYEGRISALNNLHGKDYASFDEVLLPTGAPTPGAELSDIETFIRGWQHPETGEEHRADLAFVSIYSIDFMFRDFLKAKYGRVEDLNRLAGTDFTSWIEIMPPQRDFHMLHWFTPGKTALRYEFLIRNFITVSEFVILRGRAVFNTAVFCILTILCALIVNPLAAYALSRYKPPSAYKILLFLMMTMAFPPMVTQIPNFLLLRELGLLNTFAALILPGMANGYSIFLLKGFFDSLPQDLYESAEIDGAGEFVVFWQITMRLSSPILAVIALQAFNMAYSNFMMALLVCQDQQMWTLMPWLYQLQLRSGQGVVFASLVVATIPTFIIFSLCQNVIMRGIVVPVEK